jgi:K+-transporting ATPase ATPase B chain
MTKSNTSLFQKDLVAEAFRESFVKLNPRIMFRNPVMFTVEIGTAVMLIVCLWILAGEKSQGSLVYNFIVFLVLLLTLLFANFAEAIAEARGKAQADSLRKTREETPVKLVRSEMLEVKGSREEFTSHILHLTSYISHLQNLKKAIFSFVKPEILFQWMGK